MASPFLVDVVRTVGQVGTVVLVEGESDRAAVLVLARRLGRDLAAAGVTVEAMGGATNIGHAVRRHGPDAHLVGLYDAAEEPFFRRALDGDLTGFFRCDADLEDELIRALGPDGVLDVLAAHGELRRFRSFQNQLYHRDRPLAAQLHRFLGIASGRKIRYGGLLAEALDLAAVPACLDRLLAAVR
jgi:hypothetical protein